jgi:hypothetical protein
MIQWTYKAIRRLVILVIASTLLLVGIALLVLPGPGFLFILGSIAVLAIEFVWARRLLRRLRDALPRDRKTDGPGAATGSAGSRLRRGLSRLRAGLRRRQADRRQPADHRSSP